MAHTCAGAGPVICNPSSRQSWLQQILPTTLPITKETAPRKIIDAVSLHHQVRLFFIANISSYPALGAFLRRASLFLIAGSSGYSPLGAFLSVACRSFFIAGSSGYNSLSIRFSPSRISLFHR